MKLGSIIKMERLLQEMKQETLAKDLCSVSHLSRVENNLAIPSPKLSRQLLDKLGIILKQEPAIIEDDLNREVLVLQESFRKIIDTRNKEEALNLIDILTNKDSYAYQHSYIELSLMELRLRLMFKNEVHHVLKRTKQLNLLAEDFLPIHHFRIKVIEGIAKYICGEMRLSLEIFNWASSHLNEAIVHESELADFSYIMSVASVGDYQFHTAIEQSNRAFVYFQEGFLGNRMIECLLINGIAYKQAGRYDESLGQFHRAKSLCEQLGLHGFLGRIYHNLGDTYSMKFDSKKAIGYFEQAHEEQKSPDNLIVTIFALVKEYTKLNEKTITSKWLMDGFSLLPKVSKEKRIQLTHHFNIYEGINKNDPLSLEQICLDALVFFEDKESYKHCYKYGILLANTYAEQNKYKNAVQIYQKCFEYQLKQKNLTRWENFT